MLKRLYNKLLKNPTTVAETTETGTERLRLGLFFWLVFHLGRRRILNGLVEFTNFQHKELFSLQIFSLGVVLIFFYFTISSLDILIKEKSVLKEAVLLFNLYFFLSLSTHMWISGIDSYTRVLFVFTFCFEIYVFFQSLCSSSFPGKLIALC